MPGRRAEPFRALLAAALWGACVFAAWGGLSVLLDREPVSPGAGRFFGLTALAVCGVVVWLVAALTAPSRHPWWGALGAAAATWIASVAVALPESLGLAAAQAASPFVAIAAVLAAGAVCLAWGLASHEPRSRG